MALKIETVTDYLKQVEPTHQLAFTQLRELIKSNIPKGFEEAISYGMIGYVVPHTLYAPGYHCNPSLPLPFISIAAQKNFIALYHMGIYAQPHLLKWFEDEYPKHSPSKLDMGKSCIRFKKNDTIPFDLIKTLIQKMTVNDWIDVYEQAFKPPIKSKKK